MLVAATAAAALLSSCAGLVWADDETPSPPVTSGSPGPDDGATDGATPGGPPGGTTGPQTPGESPLPADYPWQPRQAPPPLVDGEDGREPWLGGFDTVTLPESLEAAHDGAPTYSVTGIEIYEEGPDQSRVVVSYEGGEGRAGLVLSVAGVTDFPPEVTLPGGVDTGLAFLTGAHGDLGGGLEAGQLVTPAGPSRVHGVSVGPPDATMGTGIYVGLDAGAVLWAVIDHPGTLVLVVTDPGTGPTAR